MNTFYGNLKHHMYTLILILDTEGNRFGAFCTQEWKSQKYFYGTGETFLFTFLGTNEEIVKYNWTGENDHIMFSDDYSIAVGGAHGKFALYV